MPNTNLAACATCTHEQCFATPHVIKTDGARSRRHARACERVSFLPAAKPKQAAAALRRKHRLFDLNHAGRMAEHVMWRAQLQTQWRRRQLYVTAAGRTCTEKVQLQRAVRGKRQCLACWDFHALKILLARWILFGVARADGGEHALGPVRWVTLRLTAVRSITAFTS